MRVSFDIDDTLVLRDDHAAREMGLLPGWLQRRVGEPLRAGTKNLFRELKQQGCEVWIYTSSLRSRWHILWWLAVHGLRVDGVVNDDIHRAKLEELRLETIPSKYPPAFGIDLHVDDSPGVQMEGQRCGFNVLVIAQDDLNWTDKVIHRVKAGRSD